MSIIWLSCILLGGAVRGEEPHLSEVDALVQQRLQAGDMPGAVVLIGQRDLIRHRAAYGQRQLEPRREAMTPETIFDLASLTKPIVTATSIMILAEQGKLEIPAPVCRYLPEFAVNGKQDITLEQLLTHTSGLIADNALSDYAGGRRQAFEKLCQLKFVTKPGERFVYSDVGFLTLGLVVERVNGQRLDRFAEQYIFSPLKMTHTEYCPDAEDRLECAPADQRDGQWIRGVVHDPRAFALDGVAGHAGLFSTADDLSRFARMIINRGELDGVRILQPDSVEQLLVSRPVPGENIRTWGWDRQSAFSSNRGQGMSQQAIGHGGFTGTGLWIDPQTGLYVIFLSNRLHPDGKGKVNQLIGKIGTAAVHSLKPQE